MATINKLQNLDALGVRGLLEITPADTDLAQVVRQIRVGGDGDVTVRHVPGGEVVTFSGCVAGEILGPFYIDRVTAATTATSLVGWF